MAFHGGLLGVGLAILLFARRNRMPVRSLMDLSAAVVPFGLFFGRIANFINGEIYGRLSDVPWAVEFPARVLAKGDVFGPRHPTQLYEAALEGFVMFFLLRYFTHGRLSLRSPGLTTGVFLMAYGVFRIVAEYFKEWDVAQFSRRPISSKGVVYSLPMIALGAYLAATARPLLVLQDRGGMRRQRKCRASALHRTWASCVFLYPARAQDSRSSFETLDSLAGKLKEGGVRRMPSRVSRNCAAARSLPGPPRPTRAIARNWRRFYPAFRRCAAKPWRRAARRRKPGWRRGKVAELLDQYGSDAQRDRHEGAKLRERRR